MYKRIRIIFRSGDMIVIEEGYWDDYAIFDDFVVIKKEQTWVALYNKEEIFSLSLEK